MSPSRRWIRLCDVFCQTVLFVAHDIDEAFTLADDGARLVTDGT